VLVGCDSRAGNSFLVKAVVSGLLSTGMKVFYAGLTPTPALQLYVRDKGFDVGVMVTASHNPPEYSGLKVVMGDGIEAPRDVEESIEEIYHELTFRRVTWTALGYDVKVVDDVNDYYISKVVEKVDREVISKKGLKVVIDCANNVGSLTTPHVLRGLDVKVLTLNCDISHIPYRNPEPTPENLTDLVSVVRSVNADLGIAHDGDADRAIFVDSLGRVLQGDRSALMLCDHILNNKRLRIPKKVVTAVSSSTVVEEVLSKYGVEVIWTKVGSINIARTMMREGSLLGFEENGGFMYGVHQYVRDGAMATALMLEYLAYSGLTLHQLYDKLPKMYVVKTKVSVDPRSKDLIFERLKTKLLEVFSGGRVIDVDGIKFITSDYWFLVRPSGTEPLIRIYVEARDEVLANKVLNNILTLANEVSMK